MTNEYSSAQLMSFAERGMLEKVDMAALLPEELRAAFRAACADVEREITRACAANGDFCLPTGALEGEACLNALLNASPAYNKACGELWLPLFRSLKHAA